MKEDINIQIGLLVEAANECDRLSKYVEKKVNELDECNTYSYLSIEERIAMLTDLNITKMSSGHPTQEQELDLICCLLLLRAARRIKMSKRFQKGVITVEAVEPELIPGKCKNCKKDIADDSSGFCPDDNDKCWKAWIEQNKNKEIYNDY
jgi:hypothetical protein